MSDFSDWVQQEISERVSTASIEATGTLLVKANNPFSRDYDALAQGDSNQILASQGVDNNPIWIDNDDFDIIGLTLTSISGGDSIPFYNAGFLTNTRIRFTDFESTLDHDNLVNGDHIHFDIDILVADAIDGIDSLAFYDVTGGDLNKITFASFEGTLSHNNLVSGTIVSHDTTATGAQLTALIDNSVVNALHRHSELVAPDGSPDPAVSVDNDGVTIFGYDIAMGDNDILGIGLLEIVELSADPANPAEGHSRIWLSDGFDSGDDGDVMLITTAGAVTKIHTLYDHSISGTTNTLHGTGVFDALTTGTHNTGIGNLALSNVVGGDGNTAVGSGALFTNTASDLTAVGNDALYSNTDGTANTAVGKSALYNNIGGNDNTAMGALVLQANTVGVSNTAIGTSALTANIGGSFNMAVGRLALANNSEGDFNAAIGTSALQTNTTGGWNIGIGASALLDCLGGNYNVAIGVVALDDVTSGDSNVAIGFASGRGITTGDNNTIIGANVTGLSAALSGYVIIAAGDGTQRIVVDGSGNIMLGDGGVTDYVNISVTGDVTFEGTSGLILGSMYTPGVDIEVSISDTNPTEVLNATDDGWVTGELNGVTFPTGGTEHYLTITVAGKYEIIWNMSLHADTGGVQQVHGGIMIDGVAVRNNGETQRSVSTANDSADMGSLAIIDCPNGTEEISLWVASSASNDAHIVHATVIIKLVAGT